MQSIAAQETPHHVFLELLMAAFELYDRMRRAGMDTGDFDAKALVNAISIRARRQLDGFFFPEYAMYMANPRRILHTFMVRHHSYRVRIDDVQHNIGGYCLYWKNYDRPKYMSFKGSADRDDKELILIVRSCGTYLVRTADIKAGDSWANTLIEYYQTQEHASYYYINITKMEVKKIDPATAKAA